MESSLLFESLDELYARIFRLLKPGHPVPAIHIEFAKFANANSKIQFSSGILLVRITDLLEGAPAPIAEALAFILLGKLYRKSIPAAYGHRYRLYLNRKDIRRQVHLVRQTRGRKFLSGSQGSHFDLEEVFENLNREHFGGMMVRPELGWSRGRSKRLLGHYDPSHHAIIISRLFDDPGVPQILLEYVMFHEMLHLRFPVEHRGARRCVHTPEFKKAEKGFPRLKEALLLLKTLS